MCSDFDVFFSISPHSRQQEQVATGIVEEMHDT
jgi:hypothetical protein